MANSMRQVNQGINASLEVLGRGSHATYYPLAVLFMVDALRLLQAEPQTSMKNRILCLP